MTTNEHNWVVIRRAVPAEVNTVTAITDAAYEHYIPRLGRKPQPMVTDYNPMITNDEVWLLALDDQSVGVLVLLNKPDHLLIYNVAVSPLHQKRGFGRQLMSWAEQRAKQNGCHIVRLYTNALMTETIALYTQLGYVETERESYMGSTRVNMEKRLDS
jgi:ribosomal protein S18 acetylase RimI-like enzyme